MDEITRRTARDIAAGVHRREVSAREVVEAHLIAIEAENPRLRALTAVFADRARAAADRVDRAIGDGEAPGPLAGVPFSVKESIDLTWSPTTQGWKGLAGAVPQADAAVVRRMRAAGAIPIGRGNMSDFGMRWDTDNDLFGRTLNPFDEARSVYGSSGGDAVAVATGMAAIGLGNDFGGSIRLPASALGIAGLRPSFGRVPRAAVRDAGVAPTLQQFSVNGPLGRTVDDVALALGVLQGVDPADPVSLAVPPRTAAELDASPRRVGVVRDPLGWGVDADVAAGVERAAAALARAGWEVVDVDPPLLEEAAVLWRRLACTDMLLTLDEALLPVPLGRSAASFLRDSTAVARPYESAADYAAAWARRAVVAAAWRLLQVEIPLVLGPVSTRRTPERDFDLGGREAADAAWRDLRLVVAVNFLGLPAVSVPSGADRDGLPVGVQLIGPLHADELALEAARSVESAA
ncbi:amidase family protein [Microbacterium sp. BK668]|uniref:amidase n=1 Tax=Microbacterium sp. BK668 TaxID=2512118 RepID=UPI0010EE15A4|nr:amidase family protein [Microbacterium sp. BK668]TDN92035.1 amidase [Microbacterium sp. BK668]